MFTPSSLKIFIVDDDVFCLTLYEQFLKTIGYHDITSFTCGSDCLEHLPEHPNLVFADYNMETMNGIELLQQIKKADPAVTVCIITGQENASVATRALQEGASDYVLKSSLNPDRMRVLMQQAEELRATLPASETKKSFFQKVKAGLGIQ